MIKARSRNARFTRRRPLGRRLRHFALAQLRDGWILSRDFRVILLLFACLVGVGTSVLHLSYINPDTKRGLGVTESLYSVFCLLFFQPVLPFPQLWFLRLLFFLIPMLGLGILGEGMIRFGVFLFSKTARWKEWQVALASTYSDHVVVCGVGRLGYRVVQQLLQDGEEVVAIEMDEENPFLEEVRAQNVPTIIGDARDARILRQASIERARTVIPCTESDLANLEIALDARELRPGIHVVLRMFDHNLARKVERGFGINTVLSTSSLAAPAFAAAASHTALSPPIHVGDAVLHTMQFRISPGSSLAGQSVGAIERRFDLSLILHQRNGGMDLHPAPEITLQAEDRVVVFATLDVLARFGREIGGAPAAERSPSGKAAP